MAAPRPGNDERGWNDPPMFDYVSPIAIANEASTQKKTQLNKRVAFPLSGTTSSPDAVLNPDQGPPKLTPEFQILPPATTLETPTPVPMLVPSLVPTPTPCVPTTPLPVCPGEQCLNDLVSKLGIEQSELQSYVYKHFNEMVTKLQQDKLQGRAGEDVKRRLGLMNELWSEGKLSDPVKLKISNILLALKENNLKTANQLHVSLMVDHTHEVNHFMVAIKRLVQEQQNESESSNQETASQDTMPQIPLFKPPPVEIAPKIPCFATDQPSTDTPQRPVEDG
ncbi:hypothetical protein LOTGIDRAFT_228534, partial [Lottia gigantea]